MTTHQHRTPSLRAASINSIASIASAGSVDTSTPDIEHQDTVGGIPLYKRAKGSDHLDISVKHGRHANIEPVQGKKMGRITLSPDYGVQPVRRYAEEGHIQRNTLYQAQYTHENSEANLQSNSQETDNNMLFQQIKIEHREKKPGPFNVSQTEKKIIQSELAEVHRGKRDRFLKNIFHNTIGGKTQLLQKHFNQDLNLMMTLQQAAEKSSSKNYLSPPSSNNPMWNRGFGIRDSGFHGESETKFGTADRSLDKDDSDLQLLQSIEEPSIRLKRPKVDLNFKPASMRAGTQLKKQDAGTSNSSLEPQSALAQLASRRSLNLQKKGPPFQTVELPQLSGAQLTLNKKHIYPQDLDPFDALRAAEQLYQRTRHTSMGQSLVLNTTRNQIVLQAHNSGPNGNIEPPSIKTKVYKKGTSARGGSQLLKNDLMLNRSLDRDAGASKVSLTDKSGNWVPNPGSPFKISRLPRYETLQQKTLQHKSLTKDKMKNNVSAIEEELQRLQNSDLDHIYKSHRDPMCQSVQISGKKQSYETISGSQSTATGIFTYPEKDPLEKVSSPKKVRQRAGDYHSNTMKKQEKKSLRKSIQNIYGSNRYKNWKNASFDLKPRLNISNGFVQLTEEEAALLQSQCGQFFLAIDDVDVKKNAAMKTIEFNQEMRAELNDSPRRLTRNILMSKTTIDDQESQVNLKHAFKQKGAPFGPSTNDERKSEQMATKQEHVETMHTPSPSRFSLLEIADPLLKKTDIHVQSQASSPMRAGALNIAQNHLYGVTFNKQKLPHTVTNKTHAAKKKNNQKMVDEIRDLEQQIKLRRRHVEKAYESRESARVDCEKQMVMASRIQSVLYLQAQQDAFREEYNEDEFEEDEEEYDRQVTDQQEVIDEEEVNYAVEDHGPSVNQSTYGVSTTKHQFEELRQSSSEGEEDTAGFSPISPNAQRRLKVPLDSSAMGIYSIPSSNLNTNTMAPNRSHTSMQSTGANDSQDNRNESALLRLYRVKFRQDFENLKAKTYLAVEQQLQLKEQHRRQIVQFHVANQTLHRNIKNTRELCDQTDKDNIRRKNNEKVPKNLITKGGDDSGSDFDKASFLSGSIGGSISQSQNGGGKAGSLGDMRRVDKTVMTVPLIMNASKAIEAILAALRTIKAAIGKSCQKLTAFVIQKPLQRLIMRNNEKYRRFTKQLVIEDQSAIAVFQSEADYATPAFLKLKEMQWPHFSSHTLTIPVFYKDGTQWFILQASQEVVKQNAQSFMVHDQKRLGNNTEISEHTSKHLKPPGTKSSRSPSLTSRMSKTSKKSKNKGIPSFIASDFLIMKIVACMTKIKLEIFMNKNLFREKSKLKSQLLKLNMDLLQQKTVKGVIRMIKTVVPRLLGFNQCQIFLENEKQQALYTASVEDDETELLDNSFCGIKMHHIEEDYCVPENRVVSFPQNLGYSGYAYMKNAIIYMNDFSVKMKKDVTKVIPLVPAYGESLFTGLGFSFVGKLLARDVGYSCKLDNFIEFKDMRNFLISSIEDEMFYGEPKAMGVIQLYDRYEKNIEYDDCARLFHMRKLLGSCIARAQWNTIAFQTLLGFESSPARKQKLKDMVNKLDFDHTPNHETSALNLKQAVASLKLDIEKENLKLKPFWETIQKEKEQMEKDLLDVPKRRTTKKKSTMALSAKE